VPKSSELPSRDAELPWSPETEYAVVCRDVSKRFYHYEHRTTSLREFFVRSVLRRPIHVRRPHFQISGIDLRVRAGESVAFVGSNGSGKSTMLRLIAGIYPPTTGTIETRGKVGAVIELAAGFHPELTGAENIGLYATVMGLMGRDLERRFDDIVAFAGIEEFLDVPMKYYSSGMKARLGFSVAISVDPEVLLLDEVLAVGDQEFRERCLDRLRTYSGDRHTLIVVSHDLETIRELCTRGIWMESGRIRRDGPLEEVLEEYIEKAGWTPPGEEDSEEVVRPEPAAHLHHTLTGEEA
jgi:ABC-type polysaccharide/polyol phosphate transport system ATPase subunit